MIRVRGRGNRESIREEGFGVWSVMVYGIRQEEAAQRKRERPGEQVQQSAREREMRKERRGRQRGDRERGRGEVKKERVEKGRSRENGKR